MSTARAAGGKYEYRKTYHIACGQTEIVQIAHDLLFAILNAFRSAPYLQFNVTIPHPRLGMLRIPRCGAVRGAE